MALTKHDEILLAVESYLRDKVGLCSIVVSCMAICAHAFRCLCPPVLEMKCSDVRDMSCDLPLRVCSEFAWKCRFTMLAFMYSTGASGADSRHPMLSPPVVEQIG